MSVGVRYWRRGLSVFKFATAVAAPATPTRSEIAAAVDLSAQLAEITVAYQEGTISTPDYASKFTPTLPGEETGSLHMVFYDLDGTTDPVRDALVPKTNGFILLFPKGDAVGKRMEVWQVRIGAGPVDEYSTGQDAARYGVDYGLLAAPKTTVTIPA